jgi:hypothetical protein
MGMETGVDTCVSVWFTISVLTIPAFGGQSVSSVSAINVLLAVLGKRNVILKTVNRWRLFPEEVGLDNDGLE